MLSYGQTGAGKTFTMNGMLQHLAHDLFDRQAKCKGKEAKNIILENRGRNFLFKSYFKPGFNLLY